jgi:mannose-6-phosphate isomerase-like protein (cupin superfamily)
VQTLTAAENERTILGFRRETLADGVQVAHVAARRGENSLLHHHTRTRDTFYVLSGELTVTLHLASDAIPSSCYSAVCALKPSVSPGSAGQHIHRVQLLPGEVLVIQPRVVHCAANLRDEVCRFLCIEGVGDYDFIQQDLA